MRLLIASIIVDAFAVGLSIYSGIMQHRANKAMGKAIKDLHESHDELHEIIRDCLRRNKALTQRQRCSRIAVPRSGRTRRK